MYARHQAGNAANRDHPRIRFPVPWFIAVFLILIVLNSFGLIPAAAGRAADDIAGVLTIIAMAGLGLGVDLRDIRAAGLRVTAAVTLSLMFLIAGALILLRIAGLH